MFSVFKHILFYYALPYATALGCLMALINFIQERYRKANEDDAPKKIISIIFNVSIVVSVLMFLNWFFTKISIGIWIANMVHQLMLFLQNLPAIGVIASTLINWKNWIFNFIATWYLPYLKAFVLVFFFGSLVALAGLKWRVNFARALNIIIPVVVKFPYLCFQYFTGHQTPVKDLLLKGVLKAKIRENLNDSYEAAVQGYSDNGQKFENGAGGTASTQTKKATAVAIRRTDVRVLTAGGQRKAHILVHQSRETETDKSIERTLQGLGERLSGDSVYFPADPYYSSNEKGFIFDSVVSYNPAEELGSFKVIFDNPFEQHTRLELGGMGAFAVFMNDIKNLIKYITHLTPRGLRDRIIQIANTKYYYDNSVEKADYKVQQNLDLSIIPVPEDPKTHLNIKDAREKALQVANARAEDVKKALNGFHLTGQMLDVKVGGNNAIYSFAMPPDPKIPSDLTRVEMQIGNILRIDDKPIIQMKAGILTLSMNNGVNIPVSFTNMIKERKKGVSCIISGMAGVDAMQRPIYFELGDKNPHAILFGKTGTGKTVTIFTIIYSIMSATDPKHLRIAYIDGKGNSFEFMKLDGEHPNPYLYAPPADASGDIEYARALISHLESECRRRIDLFKKDAVAKLSEYNEKHSDDPLPEILAVVDEFSAITKLDDNLKASEAVKKGTVDKFEYLAKMARSVGIRLLLANQSARKELVPGKIAANITGRVSLGVSEPIEAEIALPETGIKVNQINQPGEFYSIMNGANNAEHGNSPYLSPKTCEKLNDKLTEKFGQATYVKTREEVMEEEGFVQRDETKDKPMSFYKSPVLPSQKNNPEDSNPKNHKHTGKYAYTISGGKDGKDL
ncbi:FtsK/SpoIIIE domain-containing protein [Ligilactobacillus sp. LYQ135]